MKIVVNRCYGGFGLSVKAVLEYAKFKGFKLYPCIDKYPYDFKNPRFEPCKDGDSLLIHYFKEPLMEDGKCVEDSYFLENSINRDDPALVKVVEELGEKANSRYSQLKIVEIPDNVKWEIEEYDGFERVSEIHRTW